ncbi:MAG: RCC1 domain-containing protein [Bdellovibrionales bacterium]
MGNGATTGNIDTPTLIDSSGVWTQVSAGKTSVCGIKDGHLYCWGRDNDGLMGMAQVPPPMWSRPSSLTAEEFDRCGTQELDFMPVEFETDHPTVGGVTMMVSWAMVPILRALNIRPI